MKYENLCSKLREAAKKKADENGIVLCQRGLLFDAAYIIETLEEENQKLQDRIDVYQGELGEWDDGR